jgi:flagellar protein FlaG
MSYEIGPISPIGGGGAPRRPAAATGFSLDLARSAVAKASQPAHDAAVLAVPASPPVEVREAVAAAAARAAELRESNRELHFHKDESSGRVIVQVRDLAGHVIRTIPPSHALNVMAGAAI